LLLPDTTAKEGVILVEKLRVRIEQEIFNDDAISMISKQNMSGMGGG